MKIAKDKVVEVSYVLTVDGQVFDTATKEQPLDYIHGTKMLIPKFEAQIEGKEPGETFEFFVAPAEGYGEYNPKRIIKLPLSSFEINGEFHREFLQIGRQLPMLNQNGHVEYARVTEVTEDGVTMDFNHDLAGKTLLFKGEVLSVRDATEKELKEGLHGEFLPVEECGCHDPHGEGCCHHGHHGDGGCCHHHEHKEGEGCCHGQGHCHHHEEE